MECAPNFRNKLGKWKQRGHGYFFKNVLGSELGPLLFCFDINWVN